MVTHGPPTSTPEPSRTLAPAARRLWRLEGLLTAAGALIAATVLQAAAGGTIALLGWAAAVVAGVAAVAVVPELRWRRWRWEVREHEIDIRHGTLAVTRTLVPMLRVQHVDTKRDLLQQALGLATVVFHTAAGANEIPALTVAEAAQVRDRIAELARTADELETSETGIAPRRLHPAGIAVLGLGALRDLALPLGIAFASMVLGSGGGGQPMLRAIGFGVLGAVVAVAVGYARWATTRWSVGDGTIRLRTGVISEHETEVPLGRVQAIDTVHGPVQRLFGIRGVNVQTAGGSKAGEITLPALTAADVELLRSAVSGRGAPAAEAEEPGPRFERRLSRGRLLLAALTAGQVGVILPLLAAVPQLAEELWGGDLRRAGEEGMGLVPETAPEWALAAAALVVAAWLLSTAGAVVAFAGFAVARDGDRIRIRRGLLAHRESTVPVARVQAVRIVEGVLRQPFGLVTLRVEVAGYAKEAAAAQTLFPLLRRAEIGPFLAALLPESGGEVHALEGAPRRALRRYLLPPVAGALALGAALSFVVPWWPLLVVLPAAWWGVACWRAAGWGLEDGRLAVRFRRMARTTVVAPAARLQEHGLRQTVFQRRGELADVEVAIGAGTRGRVRHLDAAVAGALFDALRRAA